MSDNMILIFLTKKQKTRKISSKAVIKFLVEFSR